MLFSFRFGCAVHPSTSVVPALLMAVVHPTSLCVATTTVVRLEQHAVRLVVDHAALLSWNRI